MTRRLQLIRGRWWGLLGVRGGSRFGVGQGTKIDHPHCLTVGNDVTIADYGYLHCLSERGVVIGNHCSIDHNLWLHCGGNIQDHAHGFVEIGDYSFIGCNAVIGAGGGIIIGSNVLIGQSVNFHAENHVFVNQHKLIREQGVTYQTIVIEDDVWIGSKATVLAGVTIGCGAVIGAGAVVTKSIPANAIAVGVPAQVVGVRGQ
jgi:acetyltransferase-like isoleucine patch superfamily enzyme